MTISKKGVNGTEGIRIGYCDAMLKDSVNDSSSNADVERVREIEPAEVVGGCLRQARSEGAIEQKQQQHISPSLEPIRNRDEWETTCTLTKVNATRNSPFVSPTSSPRQELPPKKLSRQTQIRNPDAEWLQDREEFIVPGFDENEDDNIQNEEESIWRELFPEDDELAQELDPAGALSRKPIRHRSRDTTKQIIRSKKFWTWFAIGVVQINAVALGVCNLVYQPPGLTWDFQVWRICFLVALLPFTWIFGDIFCFLTIKFVEKCLFTVPNALYFAYATKSPLRWVMRSLALTILWALMMTVATGAQNSTVNTVYDYILKVLGCITLFFTANLLKRLAAKSLALNLNKGKQQYKLEAALTKEKFLRALLRPKTQQHAWSYTNTNNTGVMEKIPKGVDDTTLEEGNADSVPTPVGTMKKSEKPRKRKDIILRLNLLEKYIRDHAISVSFKDELNQRNMSRVENEMEAKRVGSFLYWNIRGSLGSEGISRNDLLGYVPLKDVDLAFSMLDKNGDGKVTLKECIHAVDSIYLERRNLANTLKDSRNITKTLEHLIGIVVHLVFVFFYLLIFHADVSDVWVSFSGVILGFSFIFSRTVSEIFDNVVFLFGTHPYGIGDLIHLNGEQMTVEEITLNFTCMTTSSNRTVWMPNQYLIKNPFTNLSTSGKFFESIVVYVDMDVVLTHPDILDILLAACEGVRNNNASEFGDSLRCQYEFSQVPLKFGIKVVYQYSHSATNLKRTAAARTKMYTAIARVLAEQGIEYTWPAEKAKDYLSSSTAV